MAQKDPFELKQILLKGLALCVCSYHMLCSFMSIAMSIVHVWQPSVLSRVIGHVGNVGFPDDKILL